MFQISFFINSHFLIEISSIVKEAMSQLTKEVKEYQILANEKYWKIDSWQKVTVNVQTYMPISFITVNVLLESYVMYGLGQ